MVFSSDVFLFVFLPVLLGLYYCVKARNVRNMILLFASIFFYAWGEPFFVLIMLASIVLNWYLVLQMSKHDSSRKFFMLIAIVFDVGLLGIFKYATFISGNIANLTGWENVRVNIALPIGISFFTFQMMSYVFDVYYGKAQVQKNLLNLVLYISFFPQLIAGPIVRYGQIEAEIMNRHESFANFAEGVQRFVYGLGKKVLLANFLAQITDNIFDYMPNPSVMMSWLGLFTWSLQIYFDFSGYSDMAIGLGLMFGFHFQENFRYPYISKSIQEFWRRWHISLSEWFRDYVYIPMGGSRVSESRHILNIFTVWLLTGIWHGAEWSFIVWGMIHFAFLMFESKIDVRKTFGIFSPVYANLVAAFALVFLRSKDTLSGWHFLKSLFGLNANVFCDSGFFEYVHGSWLLLIIACVGCCPVIPKLREKFALEWLEQIFLILVLILSVLEIINSMYNPFIYFNF